MTSGGTLPAKNGVRLSHAHRLSYEDERPLVCHIIYRLAVGGLENGLVNLVNNLGGYRHAIVCVDEATEFRHRIAAPGTSVCEIHKRPGKDIAAYVRMWRLLRRLRPSIVHTRNLPALDMVFAARMAGIAHLVHGEHGRDMSEVDGKHRRYNRLRWSTQLFVDRYITVSRELREWLHDEVGIPDSRIELIYNGVDTSRFAPEPAQNSILPTGFAAPGAVIIGSIGRLEPIKDPVGLALAFVRILALRPSLRDNLRLIIVGDGSERAKIDEIFRQAQICDCVWMPGFRDDVARIYNAISLFVSPSVREGISNTILEAMASGCAVVATGVGGTPEILPDGLAGLLVPPRDPDALAQAILRYLDTPGLLRRHGEYARGHVVRNFSITSMVGGYDRIYRALISAAASNQKSLPR